MTVQMTHFDWVHSGLDWSKPPYESCSPNLLCLANYQMTGYLQNNWPDRDALPASRQGYLGCEGDREIRAGGTQSEHSWGAAVDWRYPKGSANPILMFLIDNSKELGICAIHDYLRSRIWHAGRTPNAEDAHGAWWKAQTPSTINGMGQAWADYFHIVTTKEAFFWSTPIHDRLTPDVPIPPPIHEPDPPVVVPGDDQEENEMAAIEALYLPSKTLIADGKDKVFVLQGDGAVRHAGDPDVQHGRAKKVPEYTIVSAEHYAQYENS